MCYCTPQKIRGDIKITFLCTAIYSVTRIMLTLIYTLSFAALIQMVHAEYSCNTVNNTKDTSFCAREVVCQGFEFNLTHPHYYEDIVAAELKQCQNCSCVRISNSSIPKLLLGFNMNEIPLDIKRLVLEGNQIQGIEAECFKGTENTIVYLSLAHNRITNKHFTLRKLEKLQVLDLSYNELESIPMQLQNTFTSSSLLELKLAGNKISQVPEFNWESLHSLTLASNNLKVINFTANLTLDLARLHLNSNNLTTLQLPSNISLDVLDVSQNLLQTLLLDNVTTTIGKLNLSSNQIQLIDEYILDTITDELDLTDNPLHCDQSICALQDYILNKSWPIPNCQSPNLFDGKTILDFNCHPSHEDNGLSIIAISVSISVLFIVLMIALAVMYLRKHGRILFVKKQQSTVDEYAYDGPGLDTFELDSSHM